MTTEAHRRLARRVNQPPAPLKNLASDVFYEILDILFTEEEAAVVSDMPRFPATAEKIAARLKRPAGEVGPILQRLADRAVIFSYGEGDARKYFVFPIFPGVYEMQFWKRPDSDETLRLAKLYDELYDREFAENLMKRPSRVFRIMPSEGSLPVEKTGVLPSDSLREVIEHHDACAAPAPGTAYPGRCTCTTINSCSSGGAASAVAYACRSAGTAPSGWCPVPIPSPFPRTTARCWWTWETSGPARAGRGTTAPLRSTARWATSCRSSCEGSRNPRPADGHLGYMPSIVSLNIAWTSLRLTFRVGVITPISSVSSSGSSVNFAIRS